MKSTPEHGEFLERVLARQRERPLHHFAYLMGYTPPAEETPEIETSFEVTPCNFDAGGRVAIGAAHTLMDIAMGAAIRGSRGSVSPMVTSNYSLFRQLGAPSDGRNLVRARCTGVSGQVALAEAELRSPLGDYIAVANFIAPRRETLSSPVAPPAAAPGEPTDLERTVSEEIRRVLEQGANGYEGLFVLRLDADGTARFGVPAMLRNRHGNTHGGASFGFAARVAELWLSRQRPGSWEFVHGTAVYASGAAPGDMIASVEVRHVSRSTAMLGVGLRTAAGRDLCHVELVYRSA